MITKNQVIDKLITEIRTDYPGILVTNDRMYAPTTFPCLEVVEISVKPVKDNINLTDTAYQSTFEVQAFSNKANGGRDEAHNIINCCEQIFADMGYRVVYKQPTENTKELTVKRHIARFTRVIASGDTI